MYEQVEALLLLRGTLNVAALEAVYENESSVYIVMELCRGGDIIKAMKSNPSNERMVRFKPPPCTSLPLAISSILDMCSIW